MLRAHALSRGGQACGSVCACRAPHIRYLGRSVESSTKCRQERPPPRRHAFPGCKKRGGQYQQGALPLVPDTTWEASEGEVDETHSRASPLAGWLRSAPSAAGSVLSQPQAPSAIRPTLSGLRFTSRPWCLHGSSGAVPRRVVRSPQRQPAAAAVRPCAHGVRPV